jgi:hypothetical protein
MVLQDVTYIVNGRKWMWKSHPFKKEFSNATTLKSEVQTSMMTMTLKSLIHSNMQFGFQPHTLYMTSEVNWRTSRNRRRLCNLKYKHAYRSPQWEALNSTNTLMFDLHSLLATRARLLCEHGVGSGERGVGITVRIL